MQRGSVCNIMKLRKLHFCLKKDFNDHPTLIILSIGNKLVLFKLKCHMAMFTIKVLPIFFKGCLNMHFNYCERETLLPKRKCKSHTTFITHKAHDPSYDIAFTGFNSFLSFSVSWHPHDPRDHFEDERSCKNTIYFLLFAVSCNNAPFPPEPSCLR